MEKSVTTTTTYVDGDNSIEVEVTNDKPTAVCLWNREDGQPHLQFQFTSSDGDVSSLIASLGEMLIRAEQDLRQAS